MKNDPASLEKLANIYEKSYHFQDAIICFEKLFSIKRSIKPLFRLAKIYEKTGDLDNSESQLRRAINEFPNADIAYLELSRFYLRYQRADLTLIEKILNKGLEINPQNSSIYALKGYLLTLKGKFLNAESTLYKAIQISPNNGLARLYLANLYFLEHKSLLLKQQLTECERLIPNSPEYLLLKGKILSFSGNFQSAISVLQKVVTLQPYNATAHFYLAKSYHSARYFRSAIKEYKITLKLSPNFRFRAEIKEALNKLTG
jgi:tetratricopeptide (TPR) repeat protein